MASQQSAKQSAKQSLNTYILNRAIYEKLVGLLSTAISFLAQNKLTKTKTFTDADILKQLVTIEFFIGKEKAKCLRDNLPLYTSKVNETTMIEDFAMDILNRLGIYDTKDEKREVSMKVKVNVHDFEEGTQNMSKMQQLEDKKYLNKIEMVNFDIFAKRHPFLLAKNNQRQIELFYSRNPNAPRRPATLFVGDEDFTVVDFDGESEITLNPLSIVAGVLDEKSAIKKREAEQKLIEELDPFGDDFVYNFNSHENPCFDDSTDSESGSEIGCFTSCSDFEDEDFPNKVECDIPLQFGKSTFYYPESHMNPECIKDDEYLNIVYSSSVAQSYRKRKSTRTQLN